MAQSHASEPTRWLGHRGYHAYVYGEQQVIAEAYGQTAGEAETRGQLFAAAPDLLAACKALDAQLDIVCGHLPCTMDDLLPMRADLKAAIARAEGK